MNALNRLDYNTFLRLRENAKFCINVLGQDANTIIYIIDGKRITAKELLQ